MKYKVDKRGRPIATATDENLKRYYNLEEEANEKEESDESSSAEDEEEESEVEGDVKEDDIKSAVPKGKLKIDQMAREKLHCQEIDYARGEADFDESSSDDDSSSSDEGEISMLEHGWGELDKDADRTEESSTRLALCNMDWDRVRAVDLMVLLNSFLPPGGVIKEVAIYPSQYGKERMEEEEKQGPKELRGDPSVKKEEESSGDDEGDSDGEDKGDEDDEDEEGSRYHREKLRQYQLNRLKYYYAVAEFDSVATAEKVYNECDGMEYESSAAKVDLRFIPDDMSFDEDTPKEVCKEMPSKEKYRPRFFTTTALQQVKVNLTWDETDPMRKELTEKIFDPKEKVDDDDIRAYLATSSEEESDEEVVEVEKEQEQTVAEEEVGKGKKKQDAISKYKALLEGIEDQEKKKKEKDVEMEITWGVGLKENTEKLVKKKMEEEEKKKRTPWEELLDKRKEKRQKRKQEKKKGKAGSGEDESEGEEDDEEQPFSDDDVDVDMDDEFFKSEMRENEIFKEGGKKKKKKDQKSEDRNVEETEAKKDAELELLMMDEDDNKRHFSLKKIIQEENDSKSKKKRRRNKLKKKNGAVVEVDQGKKDDFEIDVEDSRFSALFNSHHYNVDPSDPNFKKTKAMERIIEEKQRRRGAVAAAHQEEENGERDEVGNKKRKLEEDGTDIERKISRKQAELSTLVKSVKRNTESLKMAQKSKQNQKFGKKAKFK